MVINTLELQNPFANYGQIIEGARFVGRHNAIKEIHNRVLGSNYGNLAIMGMPKIGKSSLAWNALMVNKNQLAEKKILIERIDISTVISSKEFYCKLMDKILPHIRNLSFELYNQLLQARKNYFESENKTEIEYFFTLIKISLYRIIYILDEFDKVTIFFKLEDFQLLRELSISPDTKLCLVTISRRTIQEIETVNGAISNFYGVFSDLRLGTFSKDDINEYWEKIVLDGISISIDYKDQVEYIVGKHPYLLDLFNYNIFNSLKEQPDKCYDEIINNTESELRLNLYIYFELTLKLLNDEHLYKKVFQIVQGPIYDVTIMDIDKLLKYEIIKEVPIEYKTELLGSRSGLEFETKKTSYICFSNYFTEFLKLKLVEIDFWPLWRDTERNVRDIIRRYLKDQFGCDWENLYQELYKNSEGRMHSIKKLIDERNKAKQRFGSLASDHLIEYTYPKDMYELFISADWNWFKNIFGDTKREWANKFNLLAEIRNPFAHNNSEFVPEKKLSDCKTYCQAINDKINKWEIENPI